MADHVTDSVSGFGKPGFTQSYTVDAGGYDWVVDFRRFNKNSGMLGYFVDDGVRWIRLFDTRYDFPGSENFNRAWFTIGNKFTFNGKDYAGDAVTFDHPQDAFVFFVVPTITPTSFTQWSWAYDLSIRPHNSGPVAVNDVVAYDWGAKGSITYDIVANDTDPENNLDRSSVQITRLPKFGTVTIENGVIKYVPNAPASEDEAHREPKPDSFAYTIRDTTGEISNPANVRIKVGDCPEPLPMYVSGGDLQHHDGAEYCVIDGNFFIGREDGDANLLNVRNGTASIFEDKIILKGDVYSGAFNRLLIPNATVQLDAPAAKSSTFEGGNIALAGLRFDPKAVALEPNAVELSGRLQLTDAFDAISLDLGNEVFDPLRIAAGELQVAPLESSSATFTHFAKSWQVAVERLAFTYAVETDTMKVNGMFTVNSEFFGAPNSKGLMKGIKLDLLTQDRYLSIHDGKLSGNAAFEIRSDLKMGPIGTLSKINGSMKVEDDSLRELALGAKLKLATFTIGAEIGVKNIDPPEAQGSPDNMKLDKIKILVEAGDKGIPVLVGGVPIMYIVGASAEAKGLAATFFDDTPAPDAQLGLGGGMVFAFGIDKKVSANLAGNYITEYLGGLVGITEIDGYPLSLEVGQPSPPPGSPPSDPILQFPIGVAAHTEVNGAFKLQSLSDRLFVINGGGNYDLDAGTGSMFGHASLLNGIAEGNLSVAFGNGGATIKGVLSGSLPLRGTPFTNGASIAVEGGFSADGDSSNDYVVFAAKAQYGNLTMRGGIKLFLSEQGDGSWFQLLTPGQVRPIVGSWDTVENGPPLVMSISWTEDQGDGDVPIKVTFRPADGGPLQEFSEEDFAANGIGVFDAFTDGFAKTVVVETPAAGRWDIVPLDPGALGTITYAGYAPDNEPVVFLHAAERDINDVSTFQVRYEVAGENPVNVEFFWDDNDDGFSGQSLEFLPDVQPGEHILEFVRPGGSPDNFWVYARDVDADTEVLAPVALDATQPPEPYSFTVDVNHGRPGPIDMVFFWDTDDDGVGGVAWMGMGPVQPGPQQITIQGPSDAPPNYYVYALEGGPEGPPAMAPQFVTPSSPTAENGEFTIYYDLNDDNADGDAGVTVRWYWDTNGDGVGGTLFDTQTGVANGARTYSFDTPSGTPNDFWVYGEVDDSFNLSVTLDPVQLHSDSTHAGVDLSVTGDLGEESQPGFVNWTVTIRNNGDAPASGVVLHEDIGAGELSFDNASSGVTVEQVYETPQDLDPDDGFDPEPELLPAELRIRLDDPLQPGEEVTVSFHTSTTVVDGFRTAAGENHLVTNHRVYSDGHDANVTDNATSESTYLLDPVPPPFEPGSPTTPDISVSHTDAGLHGSERWFNLLITNNGPVAANSVQVEERLLLPQTGAQPGYLQPLPNESLNEGWHVDGFFGPDLDGDPLTRLVKIDRPLQPGETIVVPFRVGDAKGGVAEVQASLQSPAGDFDDTNNVDTFVATGLFNQPGVAFFASHSPFSYRIENGPPPTPWLTGGHLDIGTTYFSNFQISSSIGSLPTVGGVVNVRLDGSAVINFAGNTYSDDFTFPLSFLPGGVNVPGDTLIRTFSLTPTGEGDITIDLSISGMDRPNTATIAPFHTYYSAGTEAAPEFLGGVPSLTIIQDQAFSLALPDELWRKPAPDLGPVDVRILDWWLHPKELPPGQFASDERPAWLAFNPETQTFSGTMGVNDVLKWQNYDLVVRASNQHGGLTDSVIDVDIVNVNEAPFIQEAYPDRTGFVGVPLNINLPVNVNRIEFDNFNGDERSSATYFGDTDGWVVIEGQRVNEFLSIDAVDWPDFLHLEYAFGRPLLVGLPEADDIGVHTITVRATDRSGASTTQTFDLEIFPVNAPVAGAALPDAEATQEEPFIYVIPADTFVDPDGDTVSYAVHDRPAWLIYDADTRTLSGTPGPGDIGTITLEVVASDGKLGLGYGELTLTVENVNDAPLATADFFANVPVGGALFTGSSGALTDNDVDFDGDPLIAAIADAPRFGSATVDADGSFTYTVGANFKGEDKFSYTVTEPGGASSEGAVYLGVGVSQTMGAHTLIGDGGSDTLSGGQGDDSLDGRGGDDSLYGGTGIDTVLFGGGGTDSVTLDLAAGTASGAGIGSDVVLEIEHVVSGAGSDTLLGSAERNQLWGGDGHDTVDGRGDRDIIYGGNGNDRIEGAEDNDTLYGDAGDDTIYGGVGRDTIYGGAGNDTIYAGVGPDIYTGGQGDDVYYGVERSFVSGALVDNIFEDFLPGGGRDTVYAAESGVFLPNDVEVGIMDFVGDGFMIGTPGDNLIFGNDGNNSLEGSSGNDTIYGAGGIDTVSGGNGNDTMTGGAGADTFYGGTGNDLYTDVQAADRADDTSFSAAGTDTLWSIESGVTLGAGIEIGEMKFTGVGSLTGNTLANVLSANDSGSSLAGMAGVDTLYGGTGNDALDGGADLDALYGGAGNDTFIYRALNDLGDGAGYIGGASQFEQVAFNQAGSDRIDFSNIAGLNFIGDAAFSAGGTAQLRYELEASSTAVLIDADGDGAVDRYIRLDTRVDLAETALGSLVLKSATEPPSNPAPTDIALTGSSIAERSPAGTVVATISATDPGDTVMFTLADDAGGRFSIVNGNELVVSGSLNHEAAASHSIVLRATDSADNQYFEPFTITVADVNDPPTDLLLSNQSVAENSANATVVGVLTPADEDVGDTFSYTLIDDAGGGFATSGNQLIVAGALDYETAQSHNVTVRVTDLAGAFYDETFTVAVQDVNEGGGNQPPVAADDSASTDEDNAVNGAVADNVTDADNAPTELTYSVVGATPAGVVFNTNGTWSFDPAGGFDTLDSGDSAVVFFQYRASDGAANSNAATVSITVTGVNDAPVTGNDSASTDEDTTVNGTVADNTTDADDAAGELNYSVVGVVPSGLVFDPDGSWSFDPTGPGTVSFDYRASDGQAPSNTSTVTITVAAVDDSDTLFGGADPDTFYGAAGNDWLVGNDGDDSLYGGVGNDTLSSDGGVNYRGNNRLEGGDGNDVLIGGPAYDALDTAYYVNATGSVVVDLAAGTATGQGNDALFNIESAVGSGFADTISGSIAVNTLLGGGGNDTIDGRAGDDQVDGGTGNDLLYGGPGNDVVTGGAGADTFYFTSAGHDTFTDFNPGEGDVLLYGFAGATGVTITALGNVLQFDVDDVVSTITAPNYAWSGSEVVALPDDSAGDNTMFGSSGADTFFGGAGNDVLSGNDGNDTLYGGTGSDTLSSDGGSNYKGVNRMEGGDGNDILIGGPAYDALDTAYYVSAMGSVVVDLAGGTATGHGNDTLFNIESAVGSGFADTISGSATVNTLVGGLGNDTIDGRIGDDQIDGGAGNDVLYGGSGNDVVAGGAGADTFYFTSAGHDTFTDFNPGEGDVLFYSFTGANDVTITALGNVLQFDVDGIISTITAPGYAWSGSEPVVASDGSEGDNTLFGGNGADTFYGGAGNDVLTGNDGNDVIYGGIGDDILSSDGGANYMGVNHLEGGAGNDILIGGPAFDAIDTLAGGLGNDTLSGGGAADLFAYTAGDGNDIITDFDVAQGDRVDLTGIGFVGNGAGGNIAVLSDGATITAQPGYVWTGTEFI